MTRPFMLVHALNRIPSISAAWIPSVSTVWLLCSVQRGGPLRGWLEHLVPESDALELTLSRPPPSVRILGSESSRALRGHENVQKFRESREGVDIQEVPPKQHETNMRPTETKGPRGRTVGSVRQGRIQEQGKGLSLGVGLKRHRRVASPGNNPGRFKQPKLQCRAGTIPRTILIHYQCGWRKGRT